MSDDQAWADGLAVYGKDVGVWDAEVEVRFGPTPTRSKGVSTSRWTCGGRWLVTDYESDSGFSGHGVYGFDPAKGRHVGMWVDNMRGFAAVMQGRWDPATRTMEFVTEATVQGRPMRWRELTQSVDADTQVFRSLFPGPDGHETEVMTITYRRRR
jgi:hypothetical protein